MIPRAHITAWRSQAPWPEDAQVEQDLVLSKALVQLFSIPSMADQLAVRGGTVLHKLMLPGTHRYSEDIDLIWRQPGPTGHLLDPIREQLDPWLGSPRRQLSAHQVRLTYRFESEIPPTVSLRLKLEINTLETNSVLGFVFHPYEVDNPWFSGSAQICTFALEELLGTKLRALYQRKKGRDLFDLWLALEQTNVDPAQIIHCFQSYIAAEGTSISKKAFQDNLIQKLADQAFREDIAPLLAAGVSYDPSEAVQVVLKQIISLLP